MISSNKYILVFVDPDVSENYFIKRILFEFRRIFPPHFIIKVNEKTRIDYLKKTYGVLKSEFKEIDFLVFITNKDLFALEHAWRLISSFNDYNFEIINHHKVDLILTMENKVLVYFEKNFKFDLTSDFEIRLKELFSIILFNTTGLIFEFDIENKPLIKVISRVDENLFHYLAKHPKELVSLDNRLFEEMIAELFNKFGYKVELTKKTRDGGRDIIAINTAEVNSKYLIECKRYNWENKVGINIVRELYGVKTLERATKAILATTSFFTAGALEFFDTVKWELEPKDYYSILDWIKKYITKK